MTQTLALSFPSDFVARHLETLGASASGALEIAIGARDFELVLAARRWQRELLATGSPCRLFTESLAVLILVQLIRNHGSGLEIRRLKAVWARGASIE